MKIYVDLVFLLNIAMDFLLLLSVSIILKRNTKFYRIILGALVGGISIIILFLKINNLALFIIKMLVSVLMIIITFSFKNIKYFFNNLLYLYLSSIILGGGLYLLNIQFSYDNEGLIFFNNGFSLNLIVLLIISPIIIYSYINQMKKMKTTYNNCYKVDIFFKEKKYSFTAFLDTGNKLYDPYKNRPIVIVSSKKINCSYEDSILVPYKTASGNSVLKCLRPDKIVIDNNLVADDVLVGIMDEELQIDGVNMLLHSEIIGGKE